MKTKRTVAGLFRSFCANVLPVLLVAGFGLTAKAQDSASVVKSNKPVFTVVQEPPSFPGGMANWEKYARRNLRYPVSARQAKREGTVFVRFVVTEEGLIKNVTTLRPVDPEMDAEAIRLISEMPTWKPGKQGGRPVDVQYNIPVRFKL